MMIVAWFIGQRMKIISPGHPGVDPHRYGKPVGGNHSENDLCDLCDLCLLIYVYGGLAPHLFGTLGQVKV